MAVDLFLDSLAISRTFKPPSPQTGGEYFDYLEEQSYFPVVAVTRTRIARPPSSGSPPPGPPPHTSRYINEFGEELRFSAPREPWLSPPDPVVAVPAPDPRQSPQPLKQETASSNVPDHLRDQCCVGEYVFLGGPNSGPSVLKIAAGGIENATPSATPAHRLQIASVGGRIATCPCLVSGRRIATFPCLPRKRGSMSPAGVRQEPAFGHAPA